MTNNYGKDLNKTDRPPDRRTEPPPAEMQRGGFFVAQIPQVSRIFALLFWWFVYTKGTLFVYI